MVARSNPGRHKSNSLGQVVHTVTPTCLCHQAVYNLVLVVMLFGWEGNRRPVVCVQNFRNFSFLELDCLVQANIKPHSPKVTEPMVFLKMILASCNIILKRTFYCFLASVKATFGESGEIFRRTKESTIAILCL